MSAPSANWTTWAERTQYKPVVLLKIDVSTTKSFWFAAADRMISLTDVTDPIELGLLDATPISSSWDYLDPKIQAREVSFTLPYSERIKDLVSTYRLKGFPIAAWTGFVELTARADYHDFFPGGVVDDVETYLNEAKIVIRARTGHVFSRDRMVKATDIKAVTGNPVGHPLQIAEDVAEAADWPTALLDSTALDPDTYSSTISHWSTGRGWHPTGVRKIEEVQEVAGILEELAGILPGALVVSDAGKLTFRELDLSASPVVTWTDSDVEFNQVAATGPMFTRFRFQFSWQGRGATPVISSLEKDRRQNKEYLNEYTVRDTTAESNHAWPGGANLITEKLLESRWIGPEAYLENAITDSATTVRIYGANTPRFSGMRDDGSTDWNLSGGRVAWWLIRSTAGDEVVKVTAMTPDTDEVAAEIGETTPTWVPIAAADCTVVRGQRGSTAIAHAASDQDLDQPTLVYDITIIIRLLDDLSRLYSTGAPPLEALAPLREIEPEVGQIVRCTTTKYLAFGKKGITNGDFLVRNKALDPLRNQIAYELQFIPPSITVTDHIPPASFPRDPTRGTSVFFGDRDIEPYIPEGFDLTVSTLDLTLASGTAVNRVSRAQRSRASTTRTLTASKDTYAVYDPGGNILIFKQVANGATEPSLRAFEQKVGKAVTDGSAITSTTDQRTLIGLKGGQIRDFPGPEFATLAAAVTYAQDVGIPSGTTIKVGDAQYQALDKSLDELITDLAPDIYYKCDEASGTTAVDSSGNGNDGTYLNSVTLGKTALVTDGGTSVGLNADNSCVRETTVLAGSATARLVVAGVFKASDVADDQWLFSCSDSGDLIEFGVWFKDSDNNLVCRLNNSDVTMTSKKGNLKPFFLDGKPHFFVAQFLADGSTNTIELWFDGHQYSDMSASLSSALWLPTNIAWGRRDELAAGDGLEGDMDILFMLNDPIALLTEAQILAIWHRLLEEHTWFRRTDEARSWEHTLVRAQMTANISGNGATDLTYDHVLADRSNDYNPLTGEFTASEDGGYSGQASALTTTDMAANQDTRMEMLVNGTVVERDWFPEGVFDGTRGHTFRIAFTDYPLKTSDVLKFRIQTGDTAYTIAHDSELSGKLQVKKTSRLLA